MPQISLYVDHGTLNKIEKMAKKNHTSISKWVGTRIRKILNDEYPADFFTLFGSIQDASFKKPETMKFSDDAKRESI